MSANILLVGIFLILITCLDQCLGVLLNILQMSKNLTYAAFRICDCSDR